MPEDREERTREEHLDWAKLRALEYLDRGDLGRAVASMQSDLGKHPETRPPTGEVARGMMAVLDGDAERVRRWIMGFT